MLSSVLNDHIFLINSINKSHINPAFINKIRSIYGFWLFYVIKTVLGNIYLAYNTVYENNLLNDNNKETIIQNFYLNILFLIINIIGLSSHKNLKKISNYKLFKTSDSKVTIYNINSKTLFSGCSNYLSAQGKLLEMEEVFLTTQSSLNYNKSKLI
jgi:hypothetical protein